MSKLIQQGDVLVFEDSIPKNAIPIKAQQGRFILAEGEATGHAHAIDEIPGVSMFKKDNTLFLSTESEVILKHEEHKPVTIPAGTFRIDQVREIDPYTEEVRKVRD
jgi:hypothetical protein